MRFYLLLCLAGTALAQGDYERAADRALQAAGDPAALARIAAAEEPSPWLVVHELCARGEAEAATALAAAAPDKERARLAAYVALRKDKGDDAAARAVLKRATRAFRKSDARKCLEACNALAPQGDSILEAHVGVLRGYAALALRRVLEGAEAMREAGREAHRLGDWTTAADALEMGGNAAHQGQRFVAARECWLAWADVERDRGRPQREAEALYRATRTFAPLGRVVDRQLLERVLALYESLGNDQRRGELLGTFALVLLNAGDHAGALARAEEGLQLVAAGRDARARLVALRTVGDVHLGVRQMDEARPYYEQALAAAEKRGQPFEIGTALMSLGQCLREQGRHEDAQERFLRALTIFKSIKHPYAAYAMQTLGHAAEAAGDLDKALTYLKAAVRMAERHRDARLLCVCLIGLADVHLTAERPKEALPLLTRVEEMAERLEQHDLLVRVRWGKAACQLRLRKPREALATIAPAVETITRVYRGLGEEQAAEARAYYVRVFDLAAGAARDVGDDAAVFRYLELARAGSLLEALGGRARLRAAAVPNELREAEAEARTAVETARARYQEARRARDFKRSKARKKDVEAALGKLGDVIERIERASKSAAELLYPAAATPAATQALLADGEALVLYSVRDVSVLAVVVTSKAVRAVSLGDAEALRATCDAIVLDDEEEDPAELLAKVQAQIVAPLELGDGVKRVLVSPDGALSTVPFALLFGGREVVYVPSATTYGVLRAGAAGPGEKVLALGDPVYGKDLAPLPHTRAEAKAIGDVVLLGEDATPAKLAAAAAKRERWRAIHLACHGLVDTERPALSSLALTGARLDAFQVMRLDLAADLVTLSACETGKGKIVRGEGLLGLTRSFMQAGAPRVIVSLWPVEDQATRALMTAFYREWRERGTPAATALARAQAEVRAKPRWKHPRYWAAWQLWGLP